MFRKRQKASSRERTSAATTDITSAAESPELLKPEILQQRPDLLRRQANLRSGQDVSMEDGSEVGHGIPCGACIVTPVKS